MGLSINNVMIQSIVVAIIVFLIQLLFLEFLVLANAQMQREVQSHAEFDNGGWTSLTLRSGEELDNPGSVVEISQSGTGTVCAPESVLAPGTWYSEDGNEVVLPSGGGISANAAMTAGGCEWVERPEIVDQFHGIIEIIGEIIPLLLVVSVSTEAFMLVYLRGSQGGIGQVVNSRVALLVVAYVVILFGPTVFEFGEDALAVFTSNAVTGTDRFEDISKLLLSLIPLAYELMVLSILGWNTYATARAVRARYNSRASRARSMGGL